MSFNELQFLKDEIARAHARIDGLTNQSDRQAAGVAVESNVSGDIGSKIRDVDDLIDMAIRTLPNDQNLTSRKNALLQLKIDYVKSIVFGQYDENAVNEAIDKIIGEPNTSNTV